MRKIRPSWAGLQILLLIGFFFWPSMARSEETLLNFDTQVLEWALDCRQEILSEFELLLSSGQLNMGKLFDTFYIPIPNTSPQKYHTQYDKMFDAILRPILDKYVKKDKRLVFVVIVDQNGYLPTHNTRYTQPLTGDPAVDSIKNRTKRIFNDRTGLAAAKNQRQYLIQRYSRDTGEQMTDLSIPIFIRGRHWGAVRIGYSSN